MNNGEACDGANLNGKTCETLPGSSFTGGVLSCSSSCAFNTSGCTTIQQPSGIQTARDAVTGTTPAPVNINITNAVVTYVRPQQGNDDAGFFLQEGPTGPAIFVNANAGPDSPSVGDRISLTATEVVLKEVDRITAYSGYSKTGTVDLMSYYQDISEAADITTIDKYESELIVTFVTLTGDFDSLGSAGTGFKKAPIKTDGYIPTSPSRDFVLRIPTAMATAISAEAAALSKKVIGCEVYVEGLYWGYTTTTLSDTQLTIYEQDEELLVDCSNAENLPVIPEDWDYTETFSLITNVSNSYTVANNYTNNGITWIIKGRTLMTESATNYSLSEADGQGVILKKASEVEASGLMQGVSSIAFDYRMWSATTVVTIEFFNSAGDPLGTLVTETLNSTSKTTYHNPVTYSDVKKFKITASSDSRVIIDNVRWKNE
ncbi:MAG: hypothetical protein LBM75_01175 [Myxococcales bacterium]|nr:hypothetical protein [Myxococcales bacterium]